MSSSAKKLRNSKINNNTPPTQCSASDCNNPSDQQEGKIKCNGPCKAYFHYSCGKVALFSSNKPSTAIVNTWTCSQCQADLPEPTLEELRGLLLALQSKFTAVERKVDSTQSKIDNTQSKVVDIQTKIEAQSANIAEIPEMMRSLSHAHDDISDIKKICEEMQQDRALLRQELALVQNNQRSIEKRLLQLEQGQRQEEFKKHECELLLDCIPETADEDLIAIVTKAGASIKCPLNAQDLRSVERLQRKDPQAAKTTATKTPASTRPASIKIVFKDPAKRLEMLQAKRVSPRLTLHMCDPGSLFTDIKGPDGVNPAYAFLNLSLPFEMRKLFAQARVGLRHKCQYRFVTCTGTKILARKFGGGGKPQADEDWTPVEVENEAAILRLIRQFPATTHSKD